MSVKIRAHYDGKTFVPDEPVDLEIGEEIQIMLKSRSVKPAPTIEKRLAAWERFTARGVRGANIPAEALRRENMYEDRL